MACAPLVGICTASTPFVLLGDVLDCLPLDQCDTIFTFVEKNVATWKSVSGLVYFSTNIISVDSELSIDFFACISNIADYQTLGPMKELHNTLWGEPSKNHVW